MFLPLLTTSPRQQLEYYLVAVLGTIYVEPLKMMN